MDKEKIFMFLVLVGVVAYVVWENNKTPAVALGTTQDAAQTALPVDLAGAADAGPAYLTYNAPWAFSPPIGNVIPPAATSNIAMVDNSAWSDCGCGGS